jgi:hypothetical protein
MRRELFAWLLRLWKRPRRGLAGRDRGFVTLGRADDVVCLCDGARSFGPDMVFFGLGREQGLGEAVIVSEIFRVRRRDDGDECAHCGNDGQRKPWFQAPLCAP